MDCFTGLKHITQQINTILERIDPEVYACSLELLNGSSIGQHFRHMFDFYQCLEKGLQAGTQVDYAARERHSGIAANPETAKEAFDRVLQKISIQTAEKPVRVLSDFSATTNEGRVAYASSVGREVTFVHDHAVHHLAIIRIALHQLAPELADDLQLGVAPSTLKYQADNRKN